ncbi:hypothetical protein HXX01_03380 [Candidatus Nomurabacteria bacterium]|nr:hypothetical protein [Candidatus Nomurabacteria bacterium]
MTKEDQNELNEKFSNLSMSELLEVLSEKATPKKLKEQIKMFMCENFEHTTQFQFLRAVKEIEESKFNEAQKIYLINVKICTRDIKQSLELESIDSLALIGAIVEDKITIAKQLI